MMAVQKTITFRDDQEIVVTLITEIVQTKKELGKPTTFSRELIRLATKSLGISLEDNSSDFGA